MIESSIYTNIHMYKNIGNYLHDPLKYHFYGGGGLKIEIAYFNGLSILLLSASVAAVPITQSLILFF